MNWQTAYDAYPINAHSTWLNNCGITPTGRHIAVRMAEHFEQMMQRGPGDGDAAPAKLLGSIRGRLSQLLQAQPEDMALVHNTAEGMTMISMGLELAAGDEILLLDNEYPSNVYPWERWREHGVTLSFVAAGNTADEFITNFKRALSPRTKVVAISMVHWCTGMPLPIADVATLCHERGILLVIDGSQGAGLVSMDFSRVAPAVLCFSAWKWLLGPLGLGVLVVDRQTLSKLRMPFKGTDSVADPNSYLPYQGEMRASVERYTYSTANYNDWVYFDASLAFLSNLGFERVQTRIRELTARLWSGLSELGFQSAYKHAAQPLSGILSVRKPGVDIDALCNGLTQRNFVARVRLEHLRLAPHVYQSEAQMDATVKAIAELAR
ncbi:MAG TPA: aminotransferase class V-fold PLP-dependent enzyme [Polyangiaceae bacterium]